MGPLTMLVKTLPVIGGQDEERVFEKPAVPESLDQPPDMRVGIGDLAVVELDLSCVVTEGERRVDAG